MKIRSILLIILVLMFAVTGCKKDKGNGNDPVKDPDEGKEIFEISVNKSTIPEFIDIDEFDLSVIKVIVTYEDGTNREMPLAEDMIDASDLETLKKGASKRVTITYKEDFTCTANIATKDYGALDPKIGENDVIVMLSRDKENTLLVGKVLSNKGLSSLQCSFTFDNSKLSLDFSTIKYKEGYDVTVNIEENRITILLIAKDEALLKGENVLFSLKYSGDYRSSDIKIDEAYQNRVLRFENGELLDVTDVKYHFSLK